MAGDQDNTMLQIKNPTYWREYQYLTHNRRRFIYNNPDSLFESGLSCYQTKYANKDHAFRQLNLMEFDDNGLAVIHHMVIADKPLLNQVRIFCDADPGLLELRVRDQNSFTPLLLSAAVGKADSVRCLLELGSDIKQQDSSGLSALQIAALKDNEQCVKALLDHDVGQWKDLIRLISYGKNDEASACCDQLKKLLTDDTGPIEKLCTLFVEGFDGLQALKTSLQDLKLNQERIVSVMDLLTTVFEGRPKYQAKFVDIGGIGNLADILKANNDIEVLGYGFDCLLILSDTSKDWCFMMFKNGLADSLLGALRRSAEATVPLLIATIKLFSFILSSDESVAQLVGTQTDVFELLANCFDMVSQDNPAEGEELTLGLLNTFIGLSKSTDNQKQISVVPSILSSLLTLAQAINYKHIQLRAIQTIQLLADNNRECCNALIRTGAARTLQTVLDQTKSQLDIKAVTLSALWTLSGAELGEQKAIALLIGEKLLISILQDTPLNNNDDTHTLHKVASEALGVLCRGPRSRQKEVLDCDAAKVYLSILRSRNPTVVIEILRSLALLCVGTGLVPNHAAQRVVAKAATGSSTTIRLILNLVLHSNSDPVSVSAAYTLACLTLGNSTLFKELELDPDWTFLHVVKLFYSQDARVRLHAAAALSIFCFNSPQNMNHIQEAIGGLTSDSMDDLINSTNTAYRYDAAFHQIVLAQVVDGKDPAMLAANGIKCLITALKGVQDAEDSYDIELVAAAANHVASLIRLKGSGIANGLIAVGVCNVLCDIISHPNMSETGRDAASCALGFLTHLPEACRQILREIRERSFIAFMLFIYADNNSLSDEFRSRWHNMKHTHLQRLTREQKEVLSRIKNHDRTKSLTQTHLNSNRSLMASFVQHLHSTNSARRNLRSRSGSSRSRDNSASISIKTSRISLHSATEIKSLPAIEETT